MIFPQNPSKSSIFPTIKHPHYETTGFVGNFHIIGTILTGGVEDFERGMGLKQLIFHVKLHEIPPYAPLRTPPLVHPAGAAWRFFWALMPRLKKCGGKNMVFPGSSTINGGFEWYFQYSPWISETWKKKHETSCISFFGICVGSFPLTKHDDWFRVNPRNGSEMEISLRRHGNLL